MQRLHSNVIKFEYDYFFNVQGRLLKKLMYSSKITITNFPLYLLYVAFADFKQNSLPNVQWTIFHQNTASTVSTLMLHLSTNLIGLDSGYWLPGHIRVAAWQPVNRFIGYSGKGFVKSNREYDHFDKGMKYHRSATIPHE